MLTWKRVLAWAVLWAGPLCVASHAGGSVTATGGAPATFDDLIESVSRWVVAIEVEREEDETGPFAGRNRRRRAAPREVVNYFQRPEGYVSGVLLDRDGYVLTTVYNVAGKLTSIEVLLHSGERFPARLVAKSLPDDLALLRLDLPAGEDGGTFQLPLGDGPPWGDSSILRPGHFVYALGRSPDPKQLTVTRGIISAVGRNAGRAIQTDAELNYGNVGGPLVSLEGELVAIAAFVGHTRPQWGVNSGIGFGTKAATIHRILPRLKEGKSAQWAFLGVLAKQDGDGCEIADVVEDAAAAKAGLRTGDVILEFGGVPLKAFADLRSVIYTYNAFDTVELKVRRKDEVFSLAVTLGENSLRGSR